MFVDSVEVTFQAGDGGDGGLSFRHEKFIDKGGPDGGDGGDGGSVVLVASRNQNTLADFRYQKLLKASSGEPGTKRKRHGKSAQDLLVEVPVGTMATLPNGDLIADLTTDGQTFVVAAGGKGGFGNAHFISSTRQAPRISELGEKGQMVQAMLELKMIADVGIVGLPNAGKSTLLSIISNAKPTIANYPFTTLRPNLGVVDVDKKDSLLFADIPGLIEGASTGKGLGDEFLRHVERTSVLVHLIDVYNQDISAAYKTIIKELASYKVDLSSRPQIVALTKTEGMPQKDLDAKLASLKKLVPRGTEVLAISGASGEGVQDLLRLAQKSVVLDRKARAKLVPKNELPVIGLKDIDEPWQVKKNGKKFVVTGTKIENFAGRTDFSSSYGQERLLDIMRKMGIVRELEKQGIEPEQVVVVGNPKIGQLKY